MEELITVDNNEDMEQDNDMDFDIEELEQVVAPLPDRLVRN